MSAPAAMRPGWCEVTRGFREGGEYVTADRLPVGAVYRWRTYTGYRAVAVTVHPARPDSDARVTVVDGAGTVHGYRPGEVLEILPPGPWGAE